MSTEAGVAQIDQSFVRDMLVDKTDAEIIEAIVKLAQALGLELVAEGVETQEQASPCKPSVARSCRGICTYGLYRFFQFFALLRSGTLSIQ